MTMRTRRLPLAVSAPKAKRHRVGEVVGERDVSRIDDSTSKRGRHVQRPEQRNRGGTVRSRQIMMV
jgi:hypothetical protein